MRRTALVFLLGKVALGQSTAPFLNTTTTSSSRTSSLSTLQTTSTGQTTISSLTTSTGVSTTLTTEIPITTSDEVTTIDTTFSSDEPPITSDGSLTTTIDTSATTTGTGTTATGTDTSATSSSATPSATVIPNPGSVGNFSLLGCFGSTTGFPTFELVLSAASMTLDLCVASCPAGKRYAGLFGSDCFCGDIVSDATATRVSEDKCSISCPGNSGQRCGGRNVGGTLKRQLISAEILLTIYIRIDGGIDATTTATVTTTFTSVTTATVDGTASTGVTTVTTTYCPLCQDCQGPFCYKPAPNPCSNGKCFGIPCYGEDCYKKIVAYGDYCGYDYPCYGADCQRRLVWIDGTWYPEACSGYDCGRKIKCVSGKCAYVVKGSDFDSEKIICYGNVCKVETCSGDECYKKYVCKDDSCVFESCSYAEANKKYVFKHDKYIEVKGCNGSCPIPQPPHVVIPVPPVTTVACDGPTCSTLLIAPPVVTAGTSKFAASFGALAFSVLAAAVLL
ncbi:hypothetical protein BDP55DRAFT_295727 [Colletotrichum godetiae]|uniref:WSC domain-containing protein n=1 Tax=Colletotrichum godetiae TaxID=1209918 RepID=A0AAJ0ADF8_9PEZI|nr:uncharacterized protein BDP55DRAFT_295727 [Colletotrichum godetiae]KAK1671270.1 hypothetical protein BDP55DRAFT_295727 [Colletotrichum godetiae]